MGKQKWDIEIINNYMNDCGIDLKLIDNDYKNTKTFMNFVDSDGYKYYLKFERVLENIKHNSEFLKFSTSNIYALDNIENYLKINNVPLRLKSGQKYINSQSDLVFVREDNIEIKRDWSSFNQAVKNNKLSLKIMRTPESYRQEIKDLTDGEYEVLEDFINVSVPILMRHNKCG